MKVAGKSGHYVLHLCLSNKAKIANSIAFAVILSLMVLRGILIYHCLVCPLGAEIAAASTNHMVMLTRYLIAMYNYSVDVLFVRFFLIGDGRAVKLIN